MSGTGADPGRLIAVTGAGGFIGTRLVERLLAQGVRVRVLVHRRPPAIEGPADRLETIRGSLEEQSALVGLVRDATAVIHLAGLIKARSRAAFFRVNQGGTRRLLEAIADQGRPPRLVHVSSLAAREPALSAYAASKRAGEDAVTAAGRRWTVLRPPAVYGPGDVETLALFKAVGRGFGAMLGGPEARFSLIQVDDLVAAIARTLDDPTTEGRVLELDDGKEGGHSWPGMIQAAADAMGVRARAVRIPRPVLQALGVANLLLSALPGYVPMLTPGKVREIVHADWVSEPGDKTHIRGWQPVWPLDRGFAATVAWYRERRWL
jgi:nucleoside-diphosphate-sugar epimerase